jgi:hypothetical protein
MKFVITENKLDGVIIDYLKDVYEPDYGWGPELFDFYKEEVKNHKHVEFFINDRPEFAYYDATWNKKQLEIGEKIISELNLMFGKHWIGSFVKWFEDNTNLEVKEVRLLDGKNTKYLSYQD